MTVTDWRQVVDTFARAINIAGCADPDLADGQCFWVSLELQDELLTMGVECDMWCGEEAHRKDRPNAWGGHYFVVVNGEWAIDLTARQFWPDTPWPLIEQLDTYRERFERVYEDPEPT